MNSKIQYFQGSIWSSVKPTENKTKHIRIRNVKVMVLKKKKKNQSGSRPLWSVGVYLGKGGRRTGPSPAPALVTKAAAVGEELHAQVQ